MAGGTRFGLREDLLGDEWMPHPVRAIHPPGSTGLRWLRLGPTDTAVRGVPTGRVRRAIDQLIGNWSQWSESIRSAFDRETLIVVNKPFDSQMTIRR